MQSRNHGASLRAASVPGMVSLFALAALAALAACPSSTPGEPDSDIPDQGATLNEAGLTTCESPGAICAPADPCGLNPRCSKDLLCVTKSRRNCDDGISCTVDSCAPGKCQHKVKAGACLIADQCYKSGDNMGCGTCDPTRTQVLWTPRVNGLKCDDQNPCTKNDSCIHGTCVGQSYNCNDQYSCTIDACDGKGGCSNTLSATYCQISGVCYKDQQFSKDGCSVCDVTFDQKKWKDLTKTNVCKINNTCYAEGTQDFTGCQVCDPTSSKTTWKMKLDHCLIGQTCVAGNSMHPSKCARCDPANTNKQWTPVKSATMVVETFASPLVSYSTLPLIGGVGWQASKDRFTSKPVSLYYGNPGAKNYDNGKTNSGTATSGTFFLNGKKAAWLSFQLYLDVEQSINYDVLTIEANDKVVWSKTTAKLTSSDYQRWIQVTVDLAALAGKTVSISFKFNTKDDTANTLEGVYIDDVIILHGC